MQEQEPEKSDLELVRQARAGDKVAFETLIERSEAKVRHLALNMTGNAEITGELVQEAILQAYLSLPLLRNEASFKSWFYGITLNVVRGYLRENRPEVRLDSFRLDTIENDHRLTQPEGYDLSSLCEKRELYQRVLLAIGQLPPGNRKAIRLYYFEELNLAQIAADLGISVTAVKGRLHKARQALKEQILLTYPELAQERVNSTQHKAKPKTVRERTRLMVEVTISDVIIKKTPNHTPHAVIILLDKVENRFIQIWIGTWEGEHIAVGLRKFQTLRPLTYSFVEKILEATGAKLEEVRIDSLKNDTFYGIAKLQVGQHTQEIDVRPSDALALAVQVGCPIFVREEVFEKAGLPFTNLEELFGPEVKGIDSILNDLEIKVREITSELKTDDSEA